MKTFTFLFLLMISSLSSMAQINYDESVDGDLGPSMLDYFTIANGMNQWTGDLGPTLTSDADSWIITVPQNFVIDSFKYERGLIAGTVKFVWNACLYGDPYTESYKLEHTFDPPLGPGIYCVHILTDDLENENPVPWTVQVWVTGPEDPCAPFGGDNDGDGICNDTDGCPDDPSKTTPGACGCGTADTDTDSDGTADCVDGCPDDPYKIAEGVCGCGIADVDSDGDTVEDCNDVCPGFDDHVDTDADLLPDGCDACPLDPLNDVDGDGICGDIDNCPSDANADQADIDIDGLGDACDDILNVGGAGENLGNEVEEINLPAGLENSLLSKIENAMESCANGNEQAAINQLSAFINQVEAKRGNPLTNEQADELIAIAQAIIDAILDGTADCGGNVPLTFITGAPQETQIETDVTTGLQIAINSETSSSKLSLNCYPNPSSGPVTFQIAIPEPMIVSFILYDMYGREITRLIDEELFENGNHDLKWNDVNREGLFIGKLTTANQQMTTSFILNR